MKVDQKEFIIAQNKDVELYYTVSGQEDYIDDKQMPRKKVMDDQVYAKSIKNKMSRNTSDSNLKYSYFIKTNPNKELYNPLTIHSSVVDKSGSYIDKVCKTEWRFTEVNYSIFQEYLTFLKTKNIRTLNMVNRSMK